MKIKVALFVNGWNGENVDNFIAGFNGSFLNGEADLFVFTSYSTSVNSMNTSDAEDSIYLLPDMSFFDAAIVYGDGIKSEWAIPELVRRCKAADVPVILQGVDREDTSTVNVDSFLGMKELCKHIIEEHAVKEVIYIAGTPDNADSNFRMNILKETLEEHGYSFGEENVFYANWDPLQIKSYLDNNYADRSKKLPDAFVCANDQMATFLVLFLDQLGYKLPEDVIVTGFDNMEEGKFCYPSLATVDQRYMLQGEECAKLVVELMHNKKLIRKRIIPCTSVPGESCGCMNRNGEDLLRKNIGKLWRDERYISDNLSRAEFQFDICFTASVRYEDIHPGMNENFLASLGEVNPDFHIYLNPQYKELEYLNAPEGASQEIYFSSVMDTICAKTDGVIYREDTLDTRNLFLGYEEGSKGKTYIFTSVAINTFVAGYLVINYMPSAFRGRQFYELKESVDETLDKYQNTLDNYKKAIRIKEQTEEFLKQTVEALATAVDAKDSYTNGHSNRVALYARRIAADAGMTKEECDDVYLAGLLHDVGKIGIDNSIINKKGKLTEEEFAVIKLHPTLGGQILSKIVMSQSLAIGAYYHHERYDGTGYPEKLKGETIPRIARIIAVADAYDAMTSKRSYRDVIPQEKVRAELVKGIGTQFDPEYAKIMIRFMDADEEYAMREL